MIPRSLSIRAAALALALALTGCEEDVTATLGLPMPYSFYGVLNPLADTQYVRVYPIESTLELAGGDRLDAAVTSTDLQTGHVTQWRDSLLHLPNGDVGYLYWAPFRPGASRPHEVRVTRSDGAASYARVTVPALMEGVPQPPVIVQPGVADQPVFYPGTFPHVRQVDVQYLVQFGKCSFQVTRYTFPYVDQFTPQGNGHLLNLTLRRDWSLLRDSLNAEGLWDPGYNMILREVRLRTSVTDEGWEPPGGAFDPEVLVEPGLMNNVENGFGFVGSGYRYSGNIDVPVTLQEAAGFYVGPDRCDPPEPKPGTSPPPPPPVTP